MYRSRLQSLEDKKNFRKATFLALGAVGLIVFVLILGIPILVRMAIFLGDLKSSKSPVEKTDLIPPVPPNLLVSFDATNSSRQTLSGLAEPGSTVYLTQNSESRGSVVVKDDGIFQFGNVILKEGDNKFVGIAIDQVGNKSQSSREVVIYYSNKRPELNVDSPTDRQQITGNRVEIKGSTSGTRLTVNDRLIILGNNGVFSTTYNLDPGENVLVFIASDRAGNQTRKELTVTATP